MSIIGFKIGSVTERYNYPNLDNKPTIDATPTANSTNAVQSGGVKSALDGLQAQISQLGPESVQRYVEDWLDEHPEATTTVQDGSITEAKLADSLKLKTVNDYVTPEMYGAKGDGVTDDTQAWQSAVESGKKVIATKSAYKCGKLYAKNCIVNNSGEPLDVIGISGVGYYGKYTANGYTVTQIT